MSGPVALDAPYGVDVVDVTTARDMFDVVTSRFSDTDITVMAAAVGDFRPVEQARDKIKKNGRSGIELELTSIRIFWLGPASISGRTRHCADSPWRRATLRPTRRRSLTASIATCWWPTICAPPARFAADTNVVTVLTPGETADRPSIERWSKMGKDALAKRILVKLAAMRADGERR